MRTCTLSQPRFKTQPPKMGVIPHLHHTRRVPGVPDQLRDGFVYRGHLMYKWPRALVPSRPRAQPGRSPPRVRFQPRSHLNRRAWPSVGDSHSMISTTPQAPTQVVFLKSHRRLGGVGRGGRVSCANALHATPCVSPPLPPTAPYCPVRATHPRSRHHAAAHGTCDAHSGQGHHTAGLRAGGVAHAAAWTGQAPAPLSFCAAPIRPMPRVPQPGCELGSDSG